jgi:hypothetical protein
MVSLAIIVCAKAARVNGAVGEGEEADGEDDITRCGCDGAALCEHGQCRKPRNELRGLCMNKLCLDCTTSL